MANAKNKAEEYDLFEDEETETSGSQGQIVPLKEKGDKVAGIFLDVEERETTFNDPETGDEVTRSQKYFQIDTTGFSGSCHLADEELNDFVKEGNVVQVPISLTKTPVLKIAAKARRGKPLGFILADTIKTRKGFNSNFIQAVIPKSLAK